MATFYITKYALTGGIESIEAEVEYPDFAPNGWIKHPAAWQHHYIGKDAFTDRADAVRDADARRAKKVASLYKQIAKLDKLNFAATPAGQPITGAE